MAQQSFAAQIDEWVKETKQRQQAVFRESAQRVIDEMQRPGHSVASTKKAISKGIGTSGRGKDKKALIGPVLEPGGGGNLPVDTGFLRASLMASTTMPTVRDRTPVEGKTYSFDEDQVALVIAGADMGDTIFAVYGANYARAVEYGHNGAPARGFVRLAAQQWQDIVAKVAVDLKSRVASR